MKTSEKQLAQLAAFRDRERELWRSLNTYAARHGEVYRGLARMIEPNRTDPEAIRTRVAFAILSANCPFDDAVLALNYCAEHAWQPEPGSCAKYKQVPAKEGFIRTLAATDPFSYLKRDDESWHAYRMRLRKVPGLGLAKASFAAALLYPSTADVACLDTWMQKVFLRHTGFQTLSVKVYVAIEARVRRFARKHKLPSTFVAQWVIWDSARDGAPNPHQIFPGSHKAEETETAAA